MNRRAAIILLVLAGCVSAFEPPPSSQPAAGDVVCLHRLLAAEAAREPAPPAGVVVVFLYAERFASPQSVFLPPQLNPERCVTDGGRCTIAQAMSLVGAAYPGRLVVCRLIPVPHTA
jgi:hypothetical protein